MSRKTPIAVLRKRLAKNLEQQKKLYNQGQMLQYAIDTYPYKGIKFSEEEQVVNKKTKEKALIKWMHWREKFVDEDTGEAIYVNRQQAIAINGKPCNRFGQIIEFYPVGK